MSKIEKKPKMIGLRHLGSFELYQGDRYGEIFMVTALRAERPDKKHGGAEGYWVRNSHCSGWFVDRRDAVKAVMMNAGDLHEAEFNVAVVEKVRSGTCGGGYTAEATDWFFYIPHKIYAKGRWAQLKGAPKWAGHVANWWC